MGQLTAEAEAAPADVARKASLGLSRAACGWEGVVRVARAAVSEGGGLAAAARACARGSHGEWRKAAGRARLAAARTCTAACAAPDAISARSPGDDTWLRRDVSAVAPVAASLAAAALPERTADWTSLLASVAWRAERRGWVVGGVRVGAGQRWGSEAGSRGAAQSPPALPAHETHPAHTLLSRDERPWLYALSTVAPSQAPTPCRC